MEVLKDKYSITELSERLGITDHALRYYEKEFCIKIPKDSRGRRYYAPDMANLMFKIKTMRDEGLEIKAIKKILCEEQYLNEPPPVISDSLEVSIKPQGQLSPEFTAYFEDFRNQITDSLSSEVLYSREQLTAELNKTKLELGACMENGIRKLENKLDKHFTEVDRSLGIWREKNNNKKFITRLLGR